MFPCVRPQTPVSWLVTWAASVTRTLSLCHVITGPQPASVSAPVTETQLRSGKWYLSIMGHGTDRGSGNALQIGGTMPGLARHHYTIINLMSLCEEIWIIEMASHLSLLTAPRCVLRVPRIPEWRWWHLINIINVKPCMMAALPPNYCPHSSLQAANFVKTVTTRSVNSIKLTGLWLIFVFYLAALLCNNLSYQDQYPSERRWTFKQIKLVQKIEIQIDGFNLYLTGWQVPLLL